MDNKQKVRDALKYISCDYEPYSDGYVDSSEEARSVLPALETLIDRDAVIEMLEG